MIYVLEHQASKAGSLRNPMLLIRLKKGAEMENQALAERRVEEARSLLNFTYLIDSNNANSSSTEKLKPARVPSQFTHYNLGGTILLDSLDPDNMDYLPNPCLVEEVEYRQISSSSFQESWSQFASKYCQLRLYPKISKIADRIGGIMRLIGDARFSRKEMLPLFCVIGIEAILNLREERDNLSERFAMFGAALLSDDLANRKSVYRNLKKLYNFRSSFVHTGESKKNVS